MVVSKEAMHSTVGPFSMNELETWIEADRIEREYEKLRFPRPELLIKFAHCVCVYPTLRRQTHHAVLDAPIQELGVYRNINLSPEDYHEDGNLWSSVLNHKQA